MASEQDFVDHVCAQIGLGRAITCRRMFGEYALYLDGKVVAFVCDNQLYVKPTAPGREALGRVAEHAPFPGAKPHFRIDDELEQRELLQRVLRVTALALPTPRPKAKAEPKDDAVKPAKAVKRATKASTGAGKKVAPKTTATARRGAPRSRS